MNDSIKQRVDRMNDSIKQRVDRGVEWLDASYPGWEEQIDLDRLKMSICTRCVIGQLAGDFDVWWHDSDEAKMEAVACGFLVSGWNRRECTNEGREYEYSLLQEEWQRRIISRRLQGRRDAAADHPPEDTTNRIREFADSLGL